MSDQVYANGMEISCKQAAGKSICAFPDVCMTPPQTPATPPGVPIPYPNTALASDCTDGSSTVKISGGEVMLKDQSYFKKSTGDEAGSAPMKGVMTHKNGGKAYFSMWSMDVKIEGENAVRNLDLMTHNHGSFPSNTTPWPYADKAAFGKGGACEKDADPDCKLVPYDAGCPGSQTPHHVIPVHCFMGKGVRGLPKDKRIAGQFDGCKKYDMNKAPCICVKGKSKTDKHGEIHKIFDDLEDKHLEPKAPRTAGSWSYAEAKAAAVESTTQADPSDGTKKCSPACMELQVKNYHEQKEVGIAADTPLRADSTGHGTPTGFEPLPSTVPSGMD
jgi:hypothetical protein